MWIFFLLADCPEIGRHRGDELHVNNTVVFRACLRALEACFRYSPWLGPAVSAIFSNGSPPVHAPAAPIRAARRYHRFSKEPLVPNVAINVMASASQSLSLATIWV